MLASFRDPAATRLASLRPPLRPHRTSKGGSGGSGSNGTALEQNDSEQYIIEGNEFCSATPRPASNDLGAWLMVGLETVGALRRRRRA